MKPCLMKKKRIALLAVDGLDAGEARDVQEHLRTCPGCRQYSREVAEICREQMRAAHRLPDMEAGETFHWRLQRRLADEAATPAPVDWAGLLFRDGRSWRVAVPFVIVIASSCLLMWSARRNASTARMPVPNGLSTAPVTDHSLQNDLPPTVGAYRIALGRSFEELDELLNKDSARLAARSEPAVMAALSRLLPE
jgi:hypothetical protein